MTPETSFLSKYISSATITEVKMSRGKIHTLTIGETAAGSITLTDGNTYTPAFLTGDTGAQSNAATWAAVTDGEFKISINGTAYNIAGINFTGVTTMAEVATKIQTAIRAATGSTETVVWSTNKFIISSVLTTSSSAITVTSTVDTPAGTDISGAGAADWMDCDTGNGVVTAKVASGTVIAVFKANIPEQTFHIDDSFNTGLLVTTAGASKLTISYL